MKIVVVSPHRGDAAFSLTLAVQCFLSAGHNVTVLNCFTRSDSAPFADTSFVHAKDRLSFTSALRSREDETWRRQQKSALLRFIDLNLKDASLRLRCSPEELRTRELIHEEKVMHKVRRALEQLRPAALLLPLAVGGDIDHRIAKEAALPATTDLPLAFYEDLPYAAWADVTPTLEACVNALEQRLGVSLSGASTPSAGALAVQRKLRAALCYDSQIDDATAQLIAEFSLRYGGAERLWANEAWHAIHTQLTAG